ncbi:MAG: hypothetical protein KJ070_11455 [Verrucomicrobia bacterium]|nr:hypothetical protein [Verrucomicrobiota bacterium]
MPWKVSQLASNCAAISNDRYFVATDLENAFVQFGGIPQPLTNNQYVEAVHATLNTNEAVARSPGTATPAVWLTNRLVVLRAEGTVWIAPAKMAHKLDSLRSARIVQREPLPAKAPADATWLSPFGPLTTKAAKAAAAAIGKEAANATASINPATAFLVIRPDQHSRSLFDDLKQTMELAVDGRSFSLTLPGPTELTNILILVANDFAFADIYLERDLESKTLPTFHIESRTRQGFNREFSALLKSNGLALAAIAQPPRWLVARPGTLAAARDTLAAIGNQTTDEAGNQLRDGHSLSRQDTVGDPSSVEKAWLAEHEKPLALLYTYSLIIALVCGTAGLPHILVRFYTNPDGVAAKRTTMWVMILIGIFYVFPPVFGVMGRNLLPELYAGVGAKGTDKVVLELPRILNSHSPTDSLTHSQGGAVSGKVSESVSGRKRFPWGSILSGITCAGAFAAFMSTFSGLLVSMTGALAHDVYGRMLRPKSTPEQRMRMFRIGAVMLGTGAVVAGSFVEPLQINFMVGQAFAIAAASYFPLLFMSAWWRGMTMKGAATGMLTGGLLALTGITLTSFSDLGWLKLASFWAAHPLLRILCEQPAIWTVPLAITLMVVVSKLTRKEVPADIRMKMLVLHAPEKLGLKQEYIQEHQHGH